MKKDKNERTKFGTIVLRTVELSLKEAFEK